MHIKTAEVSHAVSTENLGRILKSARDVMRKDKGLNGDLDRLPGLPPVVVPHVKLVLSWYLSSQFEAERPPVLVGGIREHCVVALC